MTSSAQLPLPFGSDSPCQRWRSGRESYRPAGEVVDVRRFEVAPLSEAFAKAFVEREHYAKSFPAARWRFGLHERGGTLVGVAVFSHPTQDSVLTNTFGGAAEESTELGRFVLLDRVGANAETFFLGRCFRLLPRGLRGVVSFSDPEPRTNSAGVTVFPGHYGCIYQAHNALALGRATPRTLWLLPDGTVFSPRTAQKIRAGERGWIYGVEQLVRAGVTTPFVFERDRAAWLRAALAQVGRKVRHRGCLRYGWPLDRSLQRLARIFPPEPYLKPSDLWLQEVA